MDSEKNQNQNKEQNNQGQEMIKNSILMAVISYIGPLVIISYLVSRNDQFVKFHIKQGLALFGVEVVMWLIGMFMFIYPLWILINIINLVVLILSILGIVNALQGKEKELPLTGKFAKSFSI
jgi:uncharacterized membrane protein